MRKTTRILAKENARLNGALEDTSTWINEKKKAAAGKGIGAAIGRALAYLNGFRPMRAFQRYNAARGALLSGGIAYSALFAIAGALTIAFTVLSFVVGANQQLFDSFVAAINNALPGILKTDTNSDGLLDPQSLILDDPLNIVTIISALVLLWSALALMTNLRLSIQAMFGIARLPVNFAVGKLLDLSGFVILGVGVILSMAVTAAAHFFAEPIFELLGLPDTWGAVLLKALSIVASMMVDMLVFAFLFRVMSTARAPWRDLLYGALLGAVASGVVRYLGTAAVTSVADKPLLAPFAAIVTLLLWVNLVARITLIAAAFTANPPEQLVLKREYFEHVDETPNYATKSKLETLTWDFDPVTGVVVPDTQAKQRVVIPQWRGVRARVAQQKIRRAQEKFDAAQFALQEAQAHYDSGAIAAYRKRTRPTTDSSVSVARQQKGLPEVRAGK